MVRSRPKSVPRKAPSTRKLRPANPGSQGIRVQEKDLPKVIRALQHYAAYMRATNRDDGDYQELALALQSDPEWLAQPTNRRA